MNAYVITEFLFALNTTLSFDKDIYLCKALRSRVFNEATTPISRNAFIITEVWHVCNVIQLFAKDFLVIQLKG